MPIKTTVIGSYTITLDDRRVTNMVHQSGDWRFDVTHRHDICSFAVDAVTEVEKLRAERVTNTYYTFPACKPDYGDMVIAFCSDGLPRIAIWKKDMGFPGAGGGFATFVKSKRTCRWTRSSARARPPGGRVASHPAGRSHLIPRFGERSHEQVTSRSS